MKRARFTEEQIIGILKEAETAGNIRAVCREHNLTEQTFYRLTGVNYFFRSSTTIPAAVGFSLLLTSLLQEGHRR